MLHFAYDLVPVDDQQLFARFRQEGDAAALGELFDRTAVPLLRVATHLVPDLATAEDLLQATFLRAIEVRDAWDERQPVLPWLCGILHNRARRERWQRQRVLDTSRLESNAPTDPSRAAQHAEFDAAVDAAISELPELYRSVLRLHLAYGHAPVEIAHALERPPGTVRSQLARGLALLRQVLPAGFAGGVALTLATGRGLAAVRITVVDHARATVPATLVASALGGAVMTKKIAVACTIAVASLGAWFAWNSTRLRQPTGDQRASPSPRALAAEERVVLPSSNVAAPTRTSADPSSAVRTGALRVRCRWVEDGTPAWGVNVVVTPLGIRDGVLLQRVARTGDDGSILVEALPPDEVHVATDRGGELQIEIRAGVTQDAEIAIPAGVHVRGQVVDQTGAAVPAAEVWLSDAPHDYCDGTFAATTDRLGRFHLRSVQPERFVSATRAGSRSAVVLPVRGEPGSEVEVELVLGGAGASLIGRVFAPDGTPAADARVFVGWRQTHLRWNAAIEWCTEHRPPLDVRTAADGTYSVHGLEPGSKQAVWVRAPGCCVDHAMVELAPAGETRHDVQLATGAQLAGRATDAHGSPLPGVAIAYVSTAWHRGSDLDEHAGPDWSHHGAVSGSDGSYRVDCITPGTLRLLARKDELQVRARRTVAAHETAAWDPVLVPITIRGRVIGENGAPLAGVDVTGWPPRGQGSMAGAKTDTDGRFTCRSLAPVPYVLTFHAPGDEVRARPAATLFGVEPCGDEVLVRLVDAVLPTCAVEGRLLDKDGNPAIDARVRRSAAGLHHEPETKIDPATGTFRIGSLPPGTWRVQGIVGAPGRRSSWGEAFLLTPGATRDVGVVQMPATGSLVVRALGPEGEPLSDRSVALEQSTGWSETPWSAGKLVAGRLDIDDLAPGDYRVRVDGGPSLATVYAPVTVHAGTKTPVTVEVPAGIAVQLVLSPVSEPVPIHEHFEWRHDGVLFHRYVNWLEGKGEIVWPQRFLTGTWEVTVTSETGKQSNHRFVLREGEPDGRRVLIRLP